MTEKTPAKPGAGAAADAKKTTPAVEPEISVSPVVAAAPRVVFGKAPRDEVLYSRVRDHTRTNKSLTVLHLQRRLGLLGHGEATADLDGRYGALTEYSVSEWQTANGYDLGPLTAEQFSTIFAGDQSTTVVID